MEDLLHDLMRGNVSQVKTVLATVAVALGVYQLVLIAVGYGKLRPPFLHARAASTAHRAAGDAIVALMAFVGLACVGVYGFEDDLVVHAVAGAALLGVVAAKIAVVRRGGRLGRLLPVFGLTVFALLVLTWAMSAPEVLG